VDGVKWRRNEMKFDRHPRKYKETYCKIWIRHWVTQYLLTCAIRHNGYLGLCVSLFFIVLQHPRLIVGANFILQLLTSWRAFSNKCSLVLLHSLHYCKCLLLILLLLLLLLLLALGISFPKALKFVMAENKSRTIDVSRLIRRTSTSILPHELATQTALNWIATERRWKRKNVSRGSSVTYEMRWPRAEMKSVPTLLILLLIYVLFFCLYYLYLADHLKEMMRRWVYSQSVGYPFRSRSLYQLINIHQ